MDKIRENLERHMTELCLRTGSRHVGSAGEAAAADYLEKEFKSYGYEVVREGYPVTGWEFKSFEFINLTQKRPVPGAVACFFSNSVESEGKLLWLSSEDCGHLEDFPVRNRICMLECWSVQSNVLGRNGLAEILDRMGAAAAIFISNYHTDFAPSSKIQRSPFLDTLGALAVSQEGAFDLARHKEDTYLVRINARKFPHTSSNIIARRSGNGPRVVIGAHYDTAPFTQGAGDNATGSAIVLELARLLKDTAPDTPVDFVEFSAEEYVPYHLQPGSEDYYRRHAADGIKYFINFDDFGLLIGDPAVKSDYPEKLPAVKSRRYRFVPADQSGDDRVFHEAGIPNFWYYDINPFHQLHTPCDTLDKIDFGKMADGVLDAIDLFEQLEKIK